MRKPAQFQVTRPGLLTTVQDLGRFGHQRYGVSVSGAMDSVALRFANRLVGNPDRAAALEVSIQGPALAFKSGAVVAITGADLSPALNGRPVPNWTAFAIDPDSTLSFGARRSGARAYVAIAGGVEVPPVLGSRSTHRRSRMGGLEGRALAKGDVLSTGQPFSDAMPPVAKPLPTSVQPPYTTGPTLRVVAGPQAEYFPTGSIMALISGPYTVSPQSDRMGYRLEGPPLVHKGPAEIITDATPAGAIQVPASRQPILLLADRQTTGGYPKIAVVISADQPLAAQLVPGDWVRFTLVELAEAREALRHQRRCMDEVLPPVG